MNSKISFPRHGFIQQAVSRNYDVLNHYGLISNSGNCQGMGNTKEQLPKALTISKILYRNWRLISQSIANISQPSITLTPIGISLGKLIDTVNFNHFIKNNEANRELIKIKFNYPSFNEENNQLTYYPNHLHRKLSPISIFKGEIIDQISGIFEINIVDLLVRKQSRSFNPNQILRFQRNNNLLGLTIEDWIMQFLKAKYFQTQENFQRKHLITSSYIPKQNCLFICSENQEGQAEIETIPAFYNLPEVFEF